MNTTNPQTVVRRPEPALLAYYALSSFLAGPFFLFPLIPQFFKYRTLTYRFDEHGIAATWGILFRREVTLTYARIQDIHLSSNLVERWLGLAKIQVQTAAGSGVAGLKIEGLSDFEAVRDALYRKMRGASTELDSVPGEAPEPASGAPDGELTGVLREVAGELRALRQALAAGGQP